MTPSEQAASIDVIVEVPARMRGTYQGGDREVRGLRLDGQPPQPHDYPADFGHVPGTLSEGGDPLDALVLLDDPVVPGAVVEATPLGVLWVEHEHRKDPKLVTVLSQAAESERLAELSDLPTRRLEEFEHFFRTYKRLEHDRQARACGFGDRRMAWAEIHRSMVRARRGASVASGG